MDTSRVTRRVHSVAGGVALLSVRGLLLWLVVPAAFCAWLVIGVRLRRRGISLPQFVGWADLNLIARLQRFGIRGSGGAVTHRVPWSDMGAVTHRVSWLDPA